MDIWGTQKIELTILQAMIKSFMLSVFKFQIMFCLEISFLLHSALKVFSKLICLSSSQIDYGGAGVRPKEITEFRGFLQDLFNRTTSSSLLFYGTKKN